MNNQTNRITGVQYANGDDIYVFYQPCVDAGLSKLFLGESTDYRVPPNPSIAMSINAGPINRYSAGAGV